MEQGTMNAIVVRNVTKRFRVYHEKNATLKERLLYMGRTKFTDFFALENVSLTIPKGETTGLIGKNGSGKSTLLKILSRILYPDKGNTEVYGRISSLLELGAGFHPDFTGRENIYMNASILGISKKEIDKKLDEIIRFSELEDFINQPVRSYSSGMYMRLAFSVAINVNPDILLVDEVLAVGDASFQRKCINRFKDLKREGKTIIIVSHDLGTLEKICDKIYWFNEGKLIDSGDPKRVIDAYLTFMDKKDEERHFEYENHQVIISEEEAKIENENRWGSLDVEIISVSLIDKFGTNRLIMQTDEQILVKINYVIHKRPETFVFGVGIFSVDGVCCYGTNTYIEKTNFDLLPETGTVICKFDRFSLLPGRYTLDVAVQSEEGTPYDYQRSCMDFEMRSSKQDVGMVRLHSEWEIREI